MYELHYGMKNINPKTPPLRKDGTTKVKFEVRMQGAAGTVKKAIFIDNELLDWSIDIGSLMEAQRMGPEYFRAAQRDIQKHFVESVSEFVGRKFTAAEIQIATTTGWL